VNILVRVNPTESMDLRFSTYVANRKAKTEYHMEAGVPDYAYGADYATRQKIHAIPGAFAFFKALTNQFVPQMRQQINLQGLKVGPTQFSDVYEKVVDCARILGIGIPTVFILNDNTLNAVSYAMEDDEPLIVINSGLLERVSPGELKAVIGHECGHSHNNHTLYTLALDLIMQSLIINIPIARQILTFATMPLQLALSTWSRAAEVTADRAAVICCDDPRDALTVNAKLMYGAAFDRADVNLDAVLKQYDALRETPVRYLEITQSHPASVRRIFAEQDFLDSEVLYSWRPEWKQPGMKLISKQELDARCKKYISVTRSEKRR